MREAVGGSRDDLSTHTVHNRNCSTEVLSEFRIYGPIFSSTMLDDGKLLPNSSGRGVGLEPVTFAAGNQ